MHKFKKFIAFAMAVCLISGTVCMPVMGAAQEATSDDNIGLLYALGIYSAGDEMELVNEPLTRESAASILSVFYGVEEDTYIADTPFDDVPKYWASGHIMTMVNSGIMSGYDDGLFRPETYVAPQDAVKMLITMLGRDVPASLKGGYPNGYLLEAQQCGMLSGVNLTGDAISKGDFTQLLVNALDINVLEQVSYGEVSNFSYENKETLLSYRMDIYKATGTVNATDYASITYSGTAPDGSVLIGGKEFRCDMDLYGYLASDVEFYYRKSDSDLKGKVLYVTPLEDKNVTYVDAGDISSVNYVRGEFSYYKNNKVRKVSLASDVVVVFNGKRVTYYTNEHLKPNQGSVRLITDGNTVKYMIIDCEIDYIVDAVSQVENVVYISDLNKKTSLKCDLEKDHVTLTDNGAAIELKRLKKGDVLTVSADSVDFEKDCVKTDSTVFRMIRSANVLTGILDSTGRDTASIDGIECDLSYAAKNQKPIIGNSYTAYINYRGEIVYLENSGLDKEVFAVLHKSKVESSLSEKVSLKFYTQDGKMLISELNDNVLVDGVKYKNKTDALSALKSSSAVFAERINASLTGASLQVNDVWQIAKLKINDKNVIREIDTIVENASAEDNDFTLFMARSKEDSSKPHANGIYIGSGSIAGEIGYAADTVFFETCAASGRSDNSYKTFKGSAYSNTGFAFAAGFSVNDMNVCDVVLRVYSTDVSTNIDSLNSSNVMLLDSILNKNDVDGSEEVWVSGYYLNNGTAATVPVEDESLLGSIKSGDFIRYAIGSDGKITAIEKYLDHNAPNIDYVKANKYSAEVRISYGTAVARDDDFLLTWFDLNGDGVMDDGDWLEPRTTNNTTSVFIFDGRINTITKGTLSDICTERVHGTGDKIAAFYTSGRMPTIVIYRN